MFHRTPFGKIISSSKEQTIKVCNDLTSEITNIIEELNAERIFIVTGKSSFTISGAKEHIKEALKKKSVKIFNNFSPNPSINEVILGAKMLSDFQGDLIIAIGGGSALDIAKVINLMSTHQLSSHQVLSNDLPNKLIEDAELLPLVAIPTTGGTGSESTHFAVIYKDYNKYSVAYSKMLPKFVYLYPQLSKTNDLYATACQGFDALSQAIESYWSRGSTIESRKYARRAIKIILNNIKKAVHSPDSKNRKNMMIAANLSGRAINITKTTAPHALSYSITKEYGLPHGHAVALTLGAFFKLHSNLLINSNNKSRTKTLIKNMNSLEKIIKQFSSKGSYLYLYKLMSDCGLEYKLDILGINSEKKIKEIINSVNVERLNNHPLNLKREDLLSIFNLIPSDNHEIN